MFQPTGAVFFLSQQHRTPYQMRKTEGNRDKENQLFFSRIARLSGCISIVIGCSIVMVCSLGQQNKRCLPQRRNIADVGGWHACLLG